MCAMKHAPLGDMFEEVNHSEVWERCSTCKQNFSGEMEFELAGARYRWALGKLNLGNPDTVERAARIAQYESAARHWSNALKHVSRLAEAKHVLQERLQFLTRFLHPGDDKVQILRELRTSIALIHVDAAGTASSLATAENQANAEATLRDDLLIMQHKFGPDRPEAVSAARRLAFALFKFSKFNEAETLYRDLVQLVKVSENDLDTWIPILGLAATLNKLGKYDESEPILRANLAGISRLLGSEHPQTLKCASDLIDCLNGRGKIAEADSLSCKTLAVQERVMKWRKSLTAS